MLLAFLNYIYCGFLSLLQNLCVQIMYELPL